MKRMNLNGFPRDYIMSFFTRPGRVISPAAISEVVSKRPQISPADTSEVEAFINRRLNEASAAKPFQGFGPTSAVRVREILQTTANGQAALPGFESHFAEFKSANPLDKRVRAKIAKTLAAFSNHEGGYVFIGVEDDGSISGLPPMLSVEKFWDELADVITKYFTPFFRWERSVVDMGGARIGVAYAYQATEPPVIATGDYASEISAGRIYFRYNRSVDAITAGDLIKMLHERDRRVVAAHTAIASAE